MYKPLPKPLCINKVQILQTYCQMYNIEPVCFFFNSVFKSLILFESYLKKMHFSKLIMSTEKMTIYKFKIE